MFNLSKEVKKLPATPKSRLTKNDMIDDTAVEWKITAEHKDKKHIWHIISIKEKSTLWQNIRRYLCSMPKSRLTKNEVQILKHLVALKIQDFENYAGNAVPELKRILEKINVQLKQRS